MDADKNYYRQDDDSHFFGLVKLLAGENSDLAAHLKKCQEKERRCTIGRGNQLTFLSHNFINKTLLVTRKYMVKSIVSEIKRNGGFFGILMDTTQDISCQEECSVVVRYLNDNTEIVEHTILFYNVTNTSGKAMYEALEKELNEIGLSVLNMAGFSFDGAANMKSDHIGVNAYIKENNPGCIYIWCLSHRFNLALKAAGKLSWQITFVLTIAEDAAKLFRGSYKRMDVWAEVAKSTPNFNSLRRLKLIGTTRWSSQQDAIRSIIETKTNLYVLIKALLKLCSLKKLDGNALLAATNTLTCWLRYENVVQTYVLHKIFCTTDQTTKFLQSYGLNIIDAFDSIKDCYDNLELCKSKMDDYIQAAERFIENTNDLLRNDPEIFRLDADCSIHIPSEDEKKNIHARIKREMHTFLDNLLKQINIRILFDFDDESYIYHELATLDPRHTNEIFTVDPNANIKNLCEKCKIGNGDVAVEELKNFASEYLKNESRSKSFLNNENEFIDENEETLCMLIEDEYDLDSTVSGLQDVKLIPMKDECYCLQCILKYLNANECRKTQYKNVIQLYTYVALLPSTQVKCERDFSKLKLIKTCLRSTLSQESLENLMIVSTECKMFDNIDLGEILDELIATSTHISLYVYGDVEK